MLGRVIQVWVMSGHKGEQTFTTLMLIFSQNIFDFHVCLLFFIEFIAVTLVNKIIQVSGVQFYNTSSVYFLCVFHVIHITLHQLTYNFVPLLILTLIILILLTKLVT